MRNAAKRHLLRPTSRSPGAAKTNLSTFVHKKKRAHKDAFLFCEKMILFIGGGCGYFYRKRIDVLAGIVHRPVAHDGEEEDVAGRHERIASHERV